MKNIAIIITKLNGGGAERCASNLSIELSEKYNVYLITFDGDNITYPYKGTLLNLNIKNTNNMVERIFNVFKRVYLVRNIKKKYNISCSISLLDGPNLVNAMSKVGDRTIISIRNRLSSEFISNLRKKIILYSSKRTDLTVCLSQMVEKDMHDFFGIPKNKLKTIYNHVDAELLNSLSSKYEKPLFIDENEIYFTTIGRLNIQKGQWHLIRVFKYIVKKIPNAKLIIMGEGDLKLDLEELAIKLGIEKHVIFTGYIKNPHNILKYSEMFIFPSLFEGLGNVLLESLAFNIPIISTDCIAGPREILAPGTDLNKKITDIEYAEYGVLVPVLDTNNFNAEDELSKEEEFMKEAILKLHFDSSLRENYKSRANERVKQFSKSNVIEQWEKCISNE